MRALGLDGYREGWVYALIDEGRRCFGTIQHITEVERIEFDLAMIDVPIGLPHSGYRHCDVDARQILPSNKRSSVFLGARRPLLKYAPTREKLDDDKRRFREANEWAKADPGKGISQQMFYILPKIEQVDQFMTPKLQERIRETHPELAFWRLNNRSALDKKTSLEGQRQRLGLLRQAGFKEIENWVNSRPSYVKIDDLFDACICAVVACENLLGTSCVTPTRTVDEKGLRMEIWY